MLSSEQSSSERYPTPSVTSPANHSLSARLLTFATTFDEPAPPHELMGNDEAPVNRSVLLFYLATAFLLGVLNQFSIRMVGLMPVNEIVLCGVVAHAVFG